MRKLATAALMLVTMALAMAACGETTPEGRAKASVDRAAQKRTPYLPKHDVEFSNYNAAQKLYDSPDTIIWCSTTWGNPSAPIITVPIAGKLTSSSTTFFRPQDVESDSDGKVAIGARSVDGLFHPDPPKYRYGFTPGGQYVDFFDMPTFCTTALTKLQRQATQVSLAVDPAVAQAQRSAEQALARGDRAAAQRILTEAIGG